VASFSLCIHWTSYLAVPDKDKISATSIDEDKIRTSFQHINKDVPKSKVDNTVAFLNEMRQRT
jgi:hypothetical protein